jgi:hypothetical protein
LPIPSGNGRENRLGESQYKVDATDSKPEDVMKAADGLKQDLIRWGRTAENGAWVNWAQALSQRALILLFRLGFSENLLLESLTEGAKLGEQHRLSQPSSPIALIVPHTVRQVDEGQHRLGPSGN